MSPEVVIYALEGYPTRRHRKPSASTYALTVADLPHGGWVGQGFHREVVATLTVPEGSTLHEMARRVSQGRLRERMEESAQVFAGVAGDNGGLTGLHALLADHADLWARSEPRGTQADLRDFLHRCVHTLAARLLHDADSLAGALDVAWGADVDGDE